MIPLRRQILIRAFKLFDLGVVVFSLVLAGYLVSDRTGPGSFDEFCSMRVSVWNALFFVCLLPIWHRVFSFFRLYGSRRISSRRAEIFDILKAWTIAGLLLLAAGSLLGIETVTPLFVALFWGLGALITILSRVVLREGLGRLRTIGQNLRFVLIFGSNQKAVRLSRIIGARPKLGYRLVGFVDDGRGATGRGPGMGDSIVADFSGFYSYVRDHAVDEVWVCVSMKSHSEEINRAEAFCRKLGLIIRFFPDDPDKLPGRPAVERFEGIPVMTRYPVPLRGWSHVAKRLMDIFISFGCFLLLSPLLLLIIVLIKATSPGPAVFIQQRIGLNRRRFSLYKFRTMIEGAEEKMSDLEHLNEVPGPVFKIKDDPRVTRIGRFLRKTSLDEFPQLLNVLKGDMSLVGPRPLPVRDFERFYRDRHYRRFSVLPGLTCLWQSNGRSAIPFEEWMELDLQYIDQWSLPLDYKILLKTIPAVFSGSGAA